MKHILAALAIGFSLSAANAQQTKAIEVPALVKTSFAKMIPDAKNVKWDKEQTFYEASYEGNGHKGSVLFDANGKWTERETAIATSSLPGNAAKYMQQHYKKNQIKGAAKIVKQNGEVQYEAEVQGTEVFFTKGGGFIKAVKM